MTRVVVRRLAEVLTGLAVLLPMRAHASPSAAPSCDALRSLKTAAYGFHPKALSAPEQQAKMPQMDKFWADAKAMGADGLACLATLIDEERTDTWFLFDAAALLASLDGSGRSDRAIAQGLERTDIADVDPAAFVGLAIMLARRGADTGGAAHTYLQAPEVQTYLVRHGGYPLGRVEGALLIYGAMAPDLADKYLATEVTSARQDSRDAAAIAWSMNMTEASFKGLAALGDLSQFSEKVKTHVRTIQQYRPVTVTRPSKFSREEILGKLARFPNLDPADNAQTDALDNSFYATMRLEDLPVIREARRRLISGVSNEAIDQYDEMSRMLMNLINVLDAYAGYRHH